MKLANQYKTIVSTSYTAEIYEHCQAILQRNKRRFRLVVDHTYWRGNTGGLTDTTIFLDREEGRKLLKTIRHAQRDKLKGDYEASILSVMQEAIWSN